ncbi:3-oxoacyl-(acyl-carrier-protein) reductase [Frankia canadensis]|uniref:3-oxoacyl-(Acyl-carrier-protein) reductase n=1 Tax=Frankia canadensis TaxID=1836972 RepID=A0A2I2KRQ9_9ACTN|nr:SDR family NAD(P)-dependent oxidoreductase [Frankia canadensis]SNQ48358.1 3-oxoacyl-(acyl-carrier-protein) reductase [Frankia canadensis]SOU55648.1 3-oxoacyl-(acyl-carrier-protein) reductase [Frankia canadensis]
MELGIAGHVAVVTGGGRGLGAGICAALAAEGAHVVVLDQDRESADTLAGRLRGDGLRAEAAVADVRDDAEIRRIIDGVVERHGSLEILVNCAGLSRDAPIASMTDEEWQLVLDVCLTGPFHVTRAAVPHMLAREYGRIINISSRARLGDRNKSNYSAAKAGLVGFSSALALELASSGITSNAIAPGYIETERVRSLRYYEQLHARAMELTPTARSGQLADVSDAVLYLAAAQSGFITGEVLTVAGGRLR